LRREEKNLEVRKEYRDRDGLEQILPGHKRSYIYLSDTEAFKASLHAANMPEINPPGHELHSQSSAQYDGLIGARMPLGDLMQREGAVLGTTTLVYLPKQLPRWDHPSRQHVIYTIQYGNADMEKLLLKRQTRSHLLPDIKSKSIARTPGGTGNAAL